MRSTHGSRPLVLLAALGAVGCGGKRFDAAPPEPVSVQWQQRVDWEAATPEITAWMSTYLQVDTVNPPGNELRGARWLADVLARDGIDSTLVSFDEGRGSLWARLEGDGSTDDTLCMMSHLDVVTAEVDTWPEATGPLSGAVVDGVVWGRGALDMKSMGVLELAAFVWAKRAGVPLKRDLVLLAVADEEVGGRGIDHLVAEHWDELGCTHLVNEGGTGLKNEPFDGLDLHAISVAEKGTLWFRLVATGEPGHGSVIREGEAPARLRQAMARLDRWSRPPRIHPAMYEAFARVGAKKGGFLGGVLQSRFWFDVLARPQLLKNPVVRATFMDTIHLTGFSGANAPNVVPGEVWAQYDGRLLPGTDPDEVLAELTALVDDLDGVRIDVLEKRASTASPFDDPFFMALAAHAVAGKDRAVAGPVVSTGYTDSVPTRNLGTRAYGYAPLEMTEDQLAMFHGRDEQVPVDQLVDGARRLFGAVVQFAADLEAAVPEGPAPAPPPVEGVPAAEPYNLTGVDRPFMGERDPERRWQPLRREATTEDAAATEEPPATEAAAE